VRIAAFVIPWLVISGSLVLSLSAIATVSGVIGSITYCAGFECSLRPFGIVIGLVGVAFGIGCIAAGVGLRRGRP
jgi:hypothetical protein